jgi:capsular polysaccharide biosynthesis protein
MLYGKKLEEGRIATGLGKEMLANVAIIGPPHAASGTDLNKRIILVLFAAFVGAALGAGIAFGIEFIRNVLRTRQDVEYYLGLPVLAAVPELPPRPLMLNQ